jgi:hypothetical protein
MALIDYPDLDRVDAKNREAIECFAREHGRPTLLRMMLAYSPPVQEAMNDLGLDHHGRPGAASRRRLGNTRVLGLFLANISLRKAAYADP